MKWNKLLFSSLTREQSERHPSFDGMFIGRTPEDYETVILHTNYGIHLDTWRIFGDGSVGFLDSVLEIGDVVYWMSIPDLPKEVEDSE